MKSSGLKYFPTLDAVRAIAVSLVLIMHWFPRDIWWNQHTGEAGVALFFVLSGFLITRILLYEKDKIIERKITSGESLKRFYIKRSLRIFPIYYLLVIALYILDSIVSIGVQGSIFYFLTYTSNFLMFFLQRTVGPLSVTWSLSVEEQFYLIWPFVIFCVSLKWIKATFYITIVLSYLFLAWLSIYFPEYHSGTSLPIPCMGSFALGGMLAYHIKKHGHITSVFTYMTYVAGLVAALTGVLTFYFPSILFKYWGFGWFYFSLPAMAFLVYALHMKEGFMKRLFLNDMVISIGKMSYGIYLYHSTVSTIWPFLRNKLHSLHIYPTLLHESWVADFIVNLSITLVVAHLSYRYIEKPIISLKSKFE